MLLISFQCVYCGAISIRYIIMDGRHFRELIIVVWLGEGVDLWVAGVSSGIK